MPEGRRETPVELVIVTQGPRGALRLRVETPEGNPETDYTVSLETASGPVLREARPQAGGLLGFLPAGPARVGPAGRSGPRSGCRSSRPPW